jgi:two-component system cell cycle response regulator
MYAAKEGGRNRVESTAAGAAWDAVRNAAMY